MDTNRLPYAVVRVKQLLQAPEQYDGWRLNARAPAVGDSGAIVDVVRTSGHPDKFVVECVSSGGTTMWLADFFAEEIELV